MRNGEVHVKKTALSIDRLHVLVVMDSSRSMHKTELGEILQKVAGRYRGGMKFAIP